MRLNGLSKELQAHLEQKMVICTDFLSRNKDEKIISLKIIFDLALFILDSQNDRETFRKLYDDSLILVQYINNHFVKKVLLNMLLMYSIVKRFYLRHLQSHPYIMSKQLHILKKIIFGMNML